MKRKKGFTLIELIIVLAIFGILLAVLIPSWGYFIQRGRIRTQNNRAKALFNAAQRACTDLNFSDKRYIADYQRTDEKFKQADERLKLVEEKIFTLTSGVAAYNAKYGESVLESEKDELAEKLNKEKATCTQEKDKLTALKNKAESKIYTDSSSSDYEWYFYWNGKTLSRVDANGAYIDVTSDEWKSRADIFNEWNEKLAKEINRISDDDGVYKIYVKNFNVQSVVCSRFAYDSYIGAYPTTFDIIQDTGGVSSDILDELDDIKNDDDKKVKGANMKLFDLDKTDLFESES